MCLSDVTEFHLRVRSRLEYYLLVQIQAVLLVLPIEQEFLMCFDDLAGNVACPYLTRVLACDPLDDFANHARLQDVAAQVTIESKV
jgi:hypothetical protein